MGKKKKKKSEFVPYGIRSSVNFSFDDYCDLIKLFNRLEGYLRQELDSNAFNFADDPTSFSNSVRDLFDLKFARERFERLFFENLKASVCDDDLPF